MATKDISDWQVCAAIYDMHQRQLAGEPVGMAYPVVIELLMSSSGQPKKVCMRALDRAYRHGLVEMGLGVNHGWLTYDGILLLYQQGQPDQP